MSAAAAELAAEIDQLLGADGPLAARLPGFAPRPQQRKMAAAVARALADAETLVVEAGTGTGKTYAYLLPALLSAKKIIVSTGTRNLQDQLFHKDLPLLRQTLQLPVKASLLKGRANYLCRYRLAAADQPLPAVLAADLARITSWAGRTRSGDIGELSEVAEDSPLWPRVTSTVDTCLGAECPAYNECFVVRARRQAMEADLVVINHHLFCADMAIKEEGFGEVLPGADAFVIDEAHQLPEVAAQFFGQTLSSHQCVELARDVRVEQLRDAADFTILADLAVYLEHAAAELRLSCGRETGRTPWASLAKRPAVLTALVELNRTLARLEQALAEAAVRGKGLEGCHARCRLIQEKLTRFAAAELGEYRPDVEDEDEPDDGEQAADGFDDSVRWVDLRARSFSFNLTPLAVGEYFRARFEQYQSAWVFTSATLTVDGDFEHFSRRLGLSDPATLSLDSPFDYARSALLYHPEGLPEPAAPGYNLALLQAAVPVIAASRGRAFVLFTSHQALREAAAWLAERIEFPLLVQGTLPKTALLARFRDHGNAVLLGTSSFWEGVDVRGAALSLVVIAKLPFASPGDPVLQARIDALRRRGENPFMNYQVPQAVIALKQGIGRLIRDVDDRGVLMLGDPRLLTKAYGKIFLRSLPPMSRTRDIATVREFFAGEQP